jgi:hypothetical protein
MVMEGHVMEKDHRVITRRDFLRAGALAAAGGVIGLPFSRTAQGWNGKKSRVVLIRDRNLIDGSGAIQETVLEKMMDQAVKTLVEAPDLATAWRDLVAPSDVVGIKSNVWHHLRTPRALETMIRAKLMEAGVEEKNIAVDDRGVLRNPVFQNCTALINTRPMRTHDWSGLGTLLKNYIMFAPRPAEYHSNACEKLGAIWKFPLVKDKTRLNVLVMLTPQFHGVGPHSFSRDYVWNYSGLILSKDPVAADATGARIIQAKRDLFFQSKSPISPPPHHISTADSRFGLGNSSPDRIELIRLGWDEAILI